jgi:SAM-dependent methyltransferase
MNESSKSRPYWGPLELKALEGRGIDIGCGPDPVTPTAIRFDLEQGDANVISLYVKDQFDFVYSSHCLEHMHNPQATILEWWKLVKPGGYLFVVVPDEDLYEQGVFPSRFNNDHKATFTICKNRSWSSRSINVLELGQSLPEGTIVSLQIQDAKYDRRIMSFGPTSPNLASKLAAKCQCFITMLLGPSFSIVLRRLLTAYYPVDQTSAPYEALAQIQLIARKKQS